VSCVGSARGPTTTRGPSDEPWSRQVVWLSNSDPAPVVIALRYRQVPLTHDWFPAHAAHTPPVAPQRPLVVPGWQMPMELLQQPPLHGYPADGKQLDEQVDPLPHAMGAGQSVATLQPQK